MRRRQKFERNNPVVVKPQKIRLRDAAPAPAPAPAAEEAAVGNVTVKPGKKRKKKEGAGLTPAKVGWSYFL